MIKYGGTFLSDVSISGPTREGGIWCLGRFTGRLIENFNKFIKMV